MLRIPQCLDNRLTDGGKVVSPTHWPHFTPQKHYYYVSGTHFFYRLCKPQGLVQSIAINAMSKDGSTRKTTGPLFTKLVLSSRYNVFRNLHSEMFIYLQCSRRAVKSRLQWAACVVWMVCVKKSGVSLPVERWGFTLILVDRFWEWDVNKTGWESYLIGELWYWSLILTDFFVPIFYLSILILWSVISLFSCIVWFKCMLVYNLSVSMSNIF
jgi:hypothetical protein